MKHLFSGLLFVFLLCTVAAWTNCSSDSNPIINLDDPSTLPGNYKLISMTDNSGDLSGVPGTTFQAGEPTTVTVGDLTVSITVTSTLKLTDTRYTFATTIVTSISGLPDQSENESDTGTYSISGDTMTITSDDPAEDPVVATISVSGSRITITTSDEILVFEKQ